MLKTRTVIKVITEKLKVPAAIIVTSACFGTASAADFWADKNGGGPDEVFIDQLEFSSVKKMSTKDVITPSLKSEGAVYEIQTDVESTIYFAEPVDLSSLQLEGVDGNELLLSLADTKSRSSIASQMEIPAGQWRLVRSSESGEVRRELSDSGLGTKFGSVDPDELTLTLDSGDSGTALAVESKLSNENDGTKVHIQAHLTENNSEEDTADVLFGSVKAIQDATTFVRIFHPDGSKTRVELVDDGMLENGDDVEGDSIHSGFVKLSEPGKYRLKTVLKGNSESGKIKYTEWYSVHVSETRLTVNNYTTTPTAGHVLGDVLEDGRYGLPVEANLIRGACLIL